MNTLSAETVLRLPNPTRSLEAIQFNQPLAVPYMGADSNRTRAGAIAGARTDQNTYTLDGADVSDNVVGDNFLEALPAAVVPLPAESVEEFSAATTNANATFGRGSGGQFVIVTKRGTNAFRGSTYWYHQNDALNARSWNQERLGLEKPPLEDNRAGFSLGRSDHPQPDVLLQQLRGPAVSAQHAGGAARADRLAAGRDPALPRRGR